jgi:hypothetical protein
MEYYLAIKRSEALTYPAVERSLKSMMIQKCYAQRKKPCCDSVYINELSMEGKFIKTESR